MATIHEIGLFDHVELLEPVKHVPAGATGAVLEFRDDGRIAWVEFTSMPEDMTLERIEFVPVSKLRLIRSHDASGADAPDR